MIGQIKKLNLLFLLFIFAATPPLLAQKKDKEEAALIKQADQLFNNKQYAEALPLYSQLLAIYKADPNYHYRYGACLLFTSELKDESYSYLKFATSKGAVDPEAFYFLGKAYHLNYRFRTALNYYQDFKSKADAKLLKQYPVDLEIQACNSGSELLSNISDLNVIKKQTVKASDFYRAYDLNDFGGKLIAKPEELKTPNDLKKGDNSLIYFQPDKGKVYFSSYGESGENYDLFSAELNSEGNWVNVRSLGPTINTPYDDMYPFVNADGTMLYFSSLGHNSMGGFDIFKAEIVGDNDFKEPKNLDYAVNTPEDDILYIVDKSNREAYFASTRNNKMGDITVYRVYVDRPPLKELFIAGSYDNKGKKAAKIQIKNIETGEVISEVNTDNSGDYLVKIPNGGKFQIYVEPADEDVIHTGTFEVKKLESFRPLRQKMDVTDINGQETLVISNLFDDANAVDEETKAKLFAQKANLNVNAESGGPETNATANNEGSSENSNVNSSSKQTKSTNSEAFNPELKQKEADHLLGQVKDVEETLNQEQGILNAIAGQKYQEAQTQLSQAEQLNKELAASTDPNNAELRSKINQLRSNGVRALEEAEASVIIAQMLNSYKQNRAEKQQEIQSTYDKLFVEKDSRDAINNYSQLEQQINELLKSENSVEQAISALIAEREDLIKKNKAVVNKADSKKRDLQYANEQVDVYTKKLEETKKKKEKESFQNILDGFKAEADALKVDVSKAEKQAQTATTESNQAKAEIVSLNTILLAVNSAKKGGDIEMPSTTEPVNIADLQSGISNLKSTNQAYLTDYSTAKATPANINLTESEIALNVGSDYNAYYNGILDRIQNEIESPARKKQLEAFVYSEWAKKIQTAIVDSEEKQKSAPNKNAYTNLQDQITGLWAQYNDISGRSELANTEYKKLLVQANVNTVEGLQEKYGFEKGTADYNAQYLAQMAEAKAETYNYAKLERSIKVNEAWINDIVSEKKKLTEIEAKSEGEAAERVKRQIQALTLFETDKETELTKDYAEFEALKASLKAQKQNDDTVAFNNPNQSAVDQVDKTTTTIDSANTDSSAGNEVTTTEVEVNEPKVETPSQKMAVQYTSKVNELETISNPSEKAQKGAEVYANWADEIGSEISKLETKATIASTPQEKDAIEVEIARLEALEFEKMLLAQRSARTYYEVNNLPIPEDSLALLGMFESSDSQAYVNELEQKMQNQSAAAASGSTQTATTATALDNLDPNVAKHVDADSYKKRLTAAAELPTKSQALFEEAKIYEDFLRDLESERDVLTIKYEESFDADERSALQKSINAIDVKSQEISGVVAATYQEATKTQENEIANGILPPENTTQAPATTQPTKQNPVAAVQSIDELKQLDVSLYNSVEEVNEVFQSKIDDIDTKTSLTESEKAQQKKEVYDIWGDKLLEMINALKAKRGAEPLEEEQQKIDDQITQLENQLFELQTLAAKQQDKITNIQEQQELGSTTQGGPETSTSTSNEVTTATNPNQSSTTGETGQNPTNSSENRTAVTRPTDETTNTKVGGGGTANNVQQAQGGNIDPRVLLDAQAFKLSKQEQERLDKIENTPFTTVDSYIESLLKAGALMLQSSDLAEQANAAARAGNQELADSLEREALRIRAEVQAWVRRGGNLQPDVNAKIGNDQKTIDRIDVLLQELQRALDYQTSVIGAATPIRGVGNLESIALPVLPTVVTSPVFQTMNSRVSAYSKSRPIPFNIDMPKGLVYKVQVGAFRNPIPQDHFKGFAPISGETTNIGLTRYTAGLFGNFAAANLAKNQIRGMGYSDAFVVAYYDGKRISIAQAAKVAQTGEAPVVSGGPQSSSQQTASNSAPKQQQTTTADAAKNQYTKVNAGADVDIVNNKQVSGLFFTVQVGVFSKVVNSGILARITPLFEEEFAPGKFRYSSGIYPSINEAQKAKNVVVNAGIRDAFVTAYYNGKRITIQEANKLLQEAGPVILTSGRTNTSIASKPVQRTTASTQTPSSSANANSGIEFKVQIGAYANTMPTDVAQILLEFSEYGTTKIPGNNGLKIYLLGSFKSYDEASVVKGRIQTKGLKDVFIVAYKGSTKIDIQTALDQTN